MKYYLNLKTKIKHILSLKEKINWYYQFFIYKEKSQLLKKNYKMNYVGKKFFLVPHADDELVGGYSLIKKYNDSLELLYFGFTGSNPQNYEIRKFEFTRFCNKNNIRYRELNMAKSDLAEILKDVEYIFTPYLLDWHNEHFKVNEILAEVEYEVMKNKKIVSYAISTPIVNEDINYFVRMNKEEQKNKWKEFDESYSSQKNLPSLRFIINEQLNGKFFKEYAIETFSILNYDEWKMRFDIVKRNRTRINDLHGHINNLIDIRKIVKNIDKEMKEELNYE